MERSGRCRHRGRARPIAFKLRDAVAIVGLSTWARRSEGNWDRSGRAVLIEPDFGADADETGGKYCRIAC